MKRKLSPSNLNLIVFLLALVLLLINPIAVKAEIVFQEDFEGYLDGSNPVDWIDTDRRNSLVEKDNLFWVTDLEGNKVFHTPNKTAEIHSHYIGAGSEAFSNYEYTGRMRITDERSSLGVTFYSDYPNSDRYYRLNRAPRSSFQLNSRPDGSSMVGITDTGVIPTPGIWYWFLIQVEDSGTQTNIRAKVWQYGTAEPVDWQIVAYDDSPTRITMGTIGIWSHARGANYWDDLKVMPLAPPATDLLLTVNTVGNGTVAVDPNQAEYTEGQSITLTATADPGWIFTGWSGDMTGNANPETFVITSNSSVTATFTEITTHTLTVNIGGNGTVTLSPDKPLYDFGEVVTLTATADPGWVFAGWSGDLTGSTNPEQLTINGDHSVNANFTQVTTHTLIVNTVGNGTVILDPDLPQYDYGEVVTLTAVADASYIFTGWSGDLSGNTNPAMLTITGDATVDATFTENVPSGDGPVIDIWYGSNQRFGHLGSPQPRVNVLGNASDADGVSSLTYSLNGGPDAVLSIGRDGKRLQGWGDFNVDIDQNDLLDGLNVVEITATDGLGNISVESVSLEYSAGNIWPLPYTIDWSTANNIQDVAQVVDGVWAIEGDSIHNLQVGYDRLMAIGDLSWGEYEVQAPVTIHSVNRGGAVGLGVRWKGHTDDPHDGWQPKTGFRPLGGVGVYAWSNDEIGVRLKIWGDGGGAIAEDLSGRKLADNVTYIFKMRAQSIQNQQGDLVPLYSFKVWEDGQTEPPGWDLTAQEGPLNSHFGSVLLLTHQVDVSFGDVTITPLSDTTNPVISNINVLPSETTATISWTTNEPATSQVAYGLTSAYEIGAVSDNTLVTQHSTTLSGLAPGTPYHFQITSNDGSGNTANSQDSLFSTTGGGSTTHTLTVTTVGSGAVAVNPDQTSFNAGELAELTAIPDPGWEFSGWSGDLTGNDNPAMLIIDSDKVVTATFVEVAAVTYGLTVNTVGNGSVQVNPDQVNYNDGQVVELTAMADAGWVFSDWSGDLAGNTNPVTVVMDSDKMVTATFVVDLTPPVISNIQVTPGITSAVINWTTDEPSTSSVIYGPSTAYENGSVDDLAMVTEHSVALIGLTANSLYHFRVRSTDAGGNEAVSADDIFMTLDGSNLSGILSDDFNVCSLDGSLWTLVDPVGDASLVMNGTQALLSVPAGVNHDVWTAGNRAPRLMQPAADADFEVEVKFESTLDVAYQLQGILVEADADNFLRFDFHSNNLSTKIFAAKFENGRPVSFVNTEIGETGIAPLYMRVRRVGDQWTLAYSLDGVNWTVAVEGYSHTLAVTEVGVFVGNAGGANPAHTGSIDYFFNTAYPITPEDPEQLVCN